MIVFKTDSIKLELIMNSKLRMQNSEFEKSMVNSQWSIRSLFTIHYTLYTLFLTFLLSYSLPFFAQTIISPDPHNHTHEEGPDPIYTIPYEYQLKIVAAANIPADKMTAFFKFLQPVVREDNFNFMKLQQVKKLTAEDFSAYNMEREKKYVLLYKDFEKGQNASLSFSPPQQNTVPTSNKKKQNPLPMGPNDPCTNVDFEDTVTGGTKFYGWFGSYDTVTINAAKNPTNPINFAGFRRGATNNLGVFGGNTAIRSGNHSLMAAPTVGDPLTGVFGVVLPRVYPGGGKISLRLGNDSAYNGSERISQTFLVDPTNANTNFTYNYAVVMYQGPLKTHTVVINGVKTNIQAHSTPTQPYFRIRMYDGSSNVIPCASFDVNGTTADSVGLSILKSLTSYGDTLYFYYKQWTTVSIALTSYISQNVTIEFTTSDCAFVNGSHFAYAYIDASCNPFTLTTIPQICPNDPYTIKAPDGFVHYGWGGPGTTAADTLKNLTPGIAAKYTVTVVAFGTGGCQFTLDTTITLLPLFGSVASSSSVTCFGGTNGTASTTPATGGTNPYSYTWSNNKTGASINNLAAGNYTVTITDNNGCTFQKYTVIDQPTPITVTVSMVPAHCGQADGSATVGAAGGNPGYFYQWSTGATTQTVNGLSASNYPVSITDSQGCVASQSVTVVTTGTINVNIVPSLTVVCGSGNVTLSVSGAVNYNWGPSSGLNTTTGSVVTANITGSQTYSVTGTNGGCTGVAAITINASPVPIINTSGNAAMCEGTSVPLTANGGTSYLWTPATGLNTNTGAGVTASPAASITYTVIGSTGPCSGYSTVNVVVNPAPTAAFSTNPSGTNLYAPETICYTNQSTNYTTAIWGFGGTDTSTSVLPCRNYPDSGTYCTTLAVTNGGCFDTTTQCIVLAQEFTFFIANTFTPNGEGVNDTFYGKGTGIDWSTYRMWIFDRWGNLIFETQDINIGWDGRANGGKDIAQIDTYVWKISFKEANNRKDHKYIGHVNLLK